MVSCVCNTRSYPRDCQDVKDNGHLTSGVYRVYPACAYIGLNVYCDMDTDGGGWLVSMLLTFNWLGLTHIPFQLMLFTIQ